MFLSLPRPVSRLCVLALLLLKCAPAISQAAAAAPPGASAPALAPIAAYAALPQARGARLSPDGHHLAYIGALDGHSALVVQDLDGLEKPVRLPTGDGEVNWILWKSDDRLVFSVEAVSVREPLRKTVDTRLVGVDRDGSHLLDLVHADDAEFQPQLQDQIVSELPDDPGHLLLQLPRIDRTNRQPISGATINDRYEHPEVVRVDVRTGEIRTVTPQNGAIGDWIATPTGEVNLGWTLKRDKSVELRYRADPQAAWEPVLSLTLNKGQEFKPLAYVDGRSDRVWVRSNLEGDRTVIQEFDLPGARTVRTPGEDDADDVGAIVRHDHVVGFRRGQGGSVYIDPAWAADARAIDKALPDSINRIVDRSADGRRVLVSVERGEEPEDYWLLVRGPKGADLGPVTDNYPGLEPAQLAPQRRVTFAARDGLRIPALLTLPVGYHPAPGARLPPFVILPHGGPSSHDVQGFDWWVQFLASRGYGVLQPQFRGSTGYGRAFLVAGYRQWGLAMQDDLTDATRWLVQTNRADPRRIAIVGGSYGGYAALMGVAREPGLYRCAVAIAPVTDLDLLLEDWSRMYGDLNLPQIGEYGYARIAQTSPLNLVSRITQPVLLIHGRKDYTVPVQHSEKMERALRNAGKPVQAVYLDEADHHFLRAADRLRLLTEIEAFLAANLGPPAR